MPTRWALLLIALVVTAVIAVAVSRSFPNSGARSALAAHGRGVEPEQAAYPKHGEVVRTRAWLTAAPDMPDGVDLFIGLSDATLGRERQILPIDLLETVRRIRGLEWDHASRSWIGGGRSVGLAEIRSLLVAAMPTATDADAMIDLLAGTPAPGVPNLAALLTANPPKLTALHIVPFRGDRGRLLLDRGRPPYILAESGYNGLLASFEGDGFPSGWRVLRLKGLDP